MGGTKRRVVAGIATIPERVKQLEKAVLSLVNQVDKLNIALNNFKKVPDFLFDLPCYNIIRTNGTDEQKFRQVEGDIYLSCDDDLIYPPDYVQTILKGIEDYPDTILTFHGRNFHSYPVKSYYRDYSTKYRCLDRVEYDTYVQIGGTGCMAFEVDKFELSIEDFPFNFMADIQLSIKARNKGIPIVCLAHEAGWIKYQDVEDTIYDRFKGNDTKQTALVNSIIW